MKKRIIAVFTGNRAEYGLQLPILESINNHQNLDYRLIVSGAHLDKNFGDTLSEIKNDGYKIHQQVKIEMDAKNVISNVKAIGSGILSIGEAIRKIKPDIMVVYADRFEGFAAVVASSQMNIPTAHIEGGDITEGGALDDSVRHAMTKLSHIHFTTNQQASNRLLAMGEELWRVHTVGFPAIDLINKNNFANKEELINAYSINLSKPIVIFTQHSVTTEYQKANYQIEKSINALKKLSDEGIQIIITYPNNDAGGDAIIKKYEVLKNENKRNIQILPSLGRYNYHGFLSLAKNNDVKITCVGNSSSGIKETPVFGCPVVNIGSRQLNRLRGDNVIDVGYDENEIITAIKKCLYDKFFIKQSLNTFNPYYLGGAGKKIASILSSISLDSNILKKKMTLKGEQLNGWFN